MSLFSLRHFIYTLAICLGLAEGASAQTPDPGGPVTFSNQIVRLFQGECQQCHRPNGIGPFPLITYSDTLPQLRSIKTDVMTRKMPDAASVRLHTGCCDADTFEGPRRLTDDEIAMVVRWVDSGAPEGNRADLPPPLTFNDALWKAGEPDFIFPNTPSGFTVPAQRGKDIFRRFPFRANFPVDRYLATFEALPGAALSGADPINDHLHRIVHHVTMFVNPGCEAFDQERDFQASNPEVPGPGFEGEFTYPTTLVGMWFPGSAPLELQDGTGVKIPANSCFVMEVHYATFHAEPVVDLTYVGIRFVRQPMVNERLAPLVKNESFTIPAGYVGYQVKATMTLADDVTLYSLTPHEHQVGTDFLASTELPNGEKECLIDVEWNFTHQGTYFFNHPIHLPAGTKINTTCIYDNSAFNPNQINDPPIDIPFGKTADHEMCQLTLGLIFDKLRLTPSSPSIRSASVTGTELVIFGSDLQEGAFVEVDGKTVRDARLDPSKSFLVSRHGWRTAVHEGADVVVINPDGGRSAPMTLSDVGSTKRTKCTICLSDFGPMTP